MPLPSVNDLPAGSSITQGTGGKAVILLPPGDHTLTAPLALGPETAAIRSAAAGRATILRWSGDGPAITLNDGYGFDGEVADLDVRLLTATSDGFVLGQNTNSGAGTAKSAQVRFRGVRVQGGRYGVKAIAAQICRFEDVAIQSCDVGLYWSADLYASHATIGNTACLFVGGRIDTCRVGVQLDAGYHTTFDGVVIQQCAEEAVKALPTVHAVKQLTFRDCYFESNNYNRATGPFGQLRLGLGVIAHIDRGLFRQPNTGGNYHVSRTTNATVNVGTGACAPFVNDRSGRWEVVC